MLRTAVQIGAIVCVSSVVQAGVVVELVPDNTGPYFGGESMTVDVWLESDVSWPLLLRMIQFDFSDSDPALGLDSTFDFNFSAVPSGGGGYFSSLYPELPVPHAFQSLDCGCPGEYFHLPSDGSLRIGSIGVQLSGVPGLYRIDMLNADEPDELLGAAIRTAPWLPEFPPPSFYWRAFTGDITGGAYDFVVIPEPATGLLVLGGLLGLQSSFRRRRGRAGLGPGLVLAGMLASAGTASAQPMAVPAAEVAVDVDSGARSAAGTGSDLTVVFSQMLSVQDAPWVRLHFSEVTLGGSRAQGNESILRVTSLEDGAVQILYLAPFPADTLGFV